MKFKVLLSFIFSLVLISISAEENSSLYQKLEKSLPQKIQESFLSGASDSQIKNLRDTFAGGQKLPQDLEELFRWRNGQKQSSLLSNNHSRRMLSLEESIQEKKYFDENLLDIMAAMEGFVGPYSN